MARAFWVSAAIVAYVYVGYPALLWAWARLRSREGRHARNGVPRATPDEADDAPAVSIVIAARNEAKRLPGRIDNLLSLAGAGPRQIIVVSDGSTDETVDVVRTFGGRVEVVAIPGGGKAAALNAGVRRARHDILVFTDARQRFAADALVELTKPFADPEVGAVGGELLFDAASQQQSTIGEGVGLYWRYEKQIRRLEATVASSVGASGAIYAMRRSLWRPLPPDTILDDVLTPMRVAMSGHRVVFAGRARAYDAAAATSVHEARRKVRTLAGNYQLLALEPRLLLPWANPLWLQFVSHKLGRLIVPYLLLAIFATSAALADASLFFRGVLFGQVALYLLAAGGALREALPNERSAPGAFFRVAHTFVMMNYAAVAGLVLAVRGRRVWR